MLFCTSSADAFLRRLRREQYLDDQGYQDRIEALEKRRRGELVPNLEDLGGQERQTWDTQGWKRCSGLGHLYKHWYPESLTAL